MKIILIGAIFIIIFILMYVTYTNTYLPVVVIAHNNLHFVKNFIEQLKKYPNPIIIMDNKSDYEPLLAYYKEIQYEMGSRLEIRYLNENYGSAVFIRLKDELPKVYILSDPDLKLNPDMPYNFSEIMYNLSNKYKAFKVGLALNISDKDKFLTCSNYIAGQNIVEWERKYWEERIPDPDYELYRAGKTDNTTFCLINNDYSIQNEIRIAGNFTAKHLPWYKDYLETHMPSDELKQWKKNNNSSSILISCINH
ncbi:MAG: hypothetical protein EB127_05460 [Alphaproteobacteria bacterium]|nr:hypothetical protein [Alphaproteobacteria bacterium]